MSCQNDPSLYLDTLPPSSQVQEEWLNTSRQVRYALNVQHTWQGWILHPIDSAVTVHLLHFTHHPSSEEWLLCVRSHFHETNRTNYIWLSSTPENTESTHTYARRVGTNLPIKESGC